ncbi:MAG: discoidin domain-containing protein [Actinobacteria bacterium]|nr:discoidin domain-containing protein [Actinomycetota bacterium]
MLKSRLVPTIAVLFTLAIIATACGDSNGDTASDAAAQTVAPSAEGVIDGELFDFALVQETEFAFEADPTDPGRGIFRVVTTEPMICTIVWGETDEFGNFNNSLSMNGTGIINHDVVLPGAEQGVEYQFRVQGSTADGTQYRSETGTFTIPVTEPIEGDAIGNGDEMVVHGANLALDSTIVEASSTFGNGWEAENAIDGDNNTEWATSGDGDDGFITIDLGSEQQVVGVEFWTRSMLDGTATADMYTITIDGDEVLGPFPAGNPANPAFSTVDFAGQEVRFDIVSSTGGNVGAIEVRLFAPADGDDTDDSADS